jgi:hypothetical protein
MSGARGRIIVVLCLVGAATSVGIYLLIPAGGAGGQVVEDLLPVGRFLVGSTLGEERAGFSGRAMVQVFTRPDAPDWPSIAACLQSAEVEQEMFFFVGVLVDERQEPEVEANLRARGLKVIIRGLNGGYLGGLFQGFSSRDLSGLLMSVRLSAVIQPKRSPIYARLLETPEPIDELIFRGELDRAVKFVDFLRVFEGADHPAVLAAEARLTR